MTTSDADPILVMLADADPVDASNLVTSDDLDGAWERVRFGIAAEGPASGPIRRRRRSLLLLPVAGLAAAVVAILLITSAGPATAPAYALTRHANGSITITLSDLTTGIPALNARLEALGIDETVIPIYAGCTSPDGSGHVLMRPDPHYEYTGSVSVTITARSAQRVPAGFGLHHVLAAMRLPNGKILAFIGGLAAPVPTCLPYSSTPSDSISGLFAP